MKTIDSKAIFVLDDIFYFIVFFNERHLLCYDMGFIQLVSDTFRYFFKSPPSSTSEYASNYLKYLVLSRRTKAE